MNNPTSSSRSFPTFSLELTPEQMAACDLRALRPTFEDLLQCIHPADAERVDENFIFCDDCLSDAEILEIREFIFQMNPEGVQVLDKVIAEIAVDVAEHNLKLALTA